jgi:hypothetical protein
MTPPLRKIRERLPISILAFKRASAFGLSGKRPRRTSSFLADPSFTAEP